MGGDCGTNTQILRFMKKAERQGELSLLQNNLCVLASRRQKHALNDQPRRVDSITLSVISFREIMINLDESICIIGLLQSMNPQNGEQQQWIILNFNGVLQITKNAHALTIFVEVRVMSPSLGDIYQFSNIRKRTQLFFKCQLLP